MPKKRKKLSIVVASENRGATEKRKKLSIVVASENRGATVIPNLKLSKLVSRTLLEVPFARTIRKKIALGHLKVPAGVTVLARKDINVGRNVEFRQIGGGSAPKEIPYVPSIYHAVSQSVWKHKRSIVKSYKLDLSMIYSQETQKDLASLRTDGVTNVTSEKILFQFLQQYIQEAVTQNLAAETIDCVKIPDLYRLVVGLDQRYLSVSIVMEYVRFSDFSKQHCTEKFDHVRRSIKKCLRKHGLLHEDMNKSNVGCARTVVSQPVCEDRCPVPVLIDFGDAGFVRNLGKMSRSAET